MDVNQTYCGDHFSKCVDFKSLYYTFEINKILCVSYISKKINC